MNNKSKQLLEYAHCKANELSKHDVLKHYWSDISLILKGTTARGNADRYSDIDLVFFCSESICKKIVKDYYSNGLIERKDGLFVHFKNGHYNIESFQKLSSYFEQEDFIHIWEYCNTIALHDPHGCFVKTVKRKSENIFSNNIECIKNAYIKLQLDLDWMRQPLRRGDYVSVFLYSSNIVRGICQICYLLDSKPYPPDKWLSHYLSCTRLGKHHKKSILAYAKDTSNCQQIIKHKELEEYSIYTEGKLLIGLVAEAINKKYAVPLWVEEWYNFV